MSKYAAEGTDLISIAGKIRTKSGLSSQLTFPTGFENALDGIVAVGVNDEGKAVSNGALVAQTAHATVTENGTYDTTLNNSVVVDVGGATGVVILSGDDEPVASLGNNGNIYLKAYDTMYYDSELNWSCNSAYYVSSTEQRLCTQSTAFYKLYEGGCMAVYLHVLNNGFYGPVLVSTVENNVKYTRNNSAGGSVVIGGVTWYYSTSEYWNQQRDTTATIPLLELPTVLTIDEIVPDVLAAAQYAPGNATGDRHVAACRLKVSGAWQDLIGSNINDIIGVST